VQPFRDRQICMPNQNCRANQPCKRAKNVAPQFANAAPKIYKTDVRDSLPSFHLSYIRAVTPPNLTQHFERSSFASESGVPRFGDRRHGRGPLRPATRDGIDPNGQRACRELRRGAAGGRTSERFRHGHAALAVDATATFMFSVCCGSGAKAEALIVSMLCDRAPKEFG
jgi:hypothetical protein